jgi:hypothetical protein
VAPRSLVPIRPMSEPLPNTRSGGDGTRDHQAPRFSSASAREVTSP